MLRKEVKTLYHWYTLVSWFRACLWEYLVRNVRNLRGSLRACDLFACQAVDDLICPPLPLWLYQTNQGGGFFLLLKKKNSSETWMNERHFTKEARPPALEQLGSEMYEAYVWPQTEGSEWRRVDRRPVTSRSWGWKIWSGHSESTTRQSLKGSGVRGHHLPPKKKKNVATVQFCHWANSMGRVYTRAHTHKHTQSIPARARRGAAPPGGFQSSATHPDWESGSTCNISSQWECSTSTQRDEADIC